MHIASNWDLNALKAIVGSLVGLLHDQDTFSLVEQKNGSPLKNDFFDSLSSGAAIMVVIRSSDFD